ncbi:MAG: sigma-70 family RNA polymerase sigma factor [Tissierellales bacterium]|nr:sigma-70 family RNA polymerase sigma factor [Tissierellales bacterium]
MNIKFVIKLIKPYIKNKQLKEKDFEKVFSFLDLHEKYSVINILIENDIEIVYEDELTDTEDLEENQENYNLTQNKFFKKDIKISNEQLCLMYQNGDKKALDLLYMKNKAFIWKKAKKLSKWYNHKLDEEDLVAYGFFGFKKAADRFDNSLDNKFLTYAGYWIKQSITRAIADYGFTIRIPVHMFENVNYIRRIIRDKAFDNRESLIEFISKEREVEKSQVTNWMNIAERSNKPNVFNGFRYLTNDYYINKLGDKYE